jgi:hypothetical protein
LIRLPLLAAGLAICFGVRFLSRRWTRNVIRLRDGRRVRLLSSVALVGEAASDLLALEYFSSSADQSPEALRHEARSLVQTVGERAEYATCRRAIVAVRRSAGGQADAAAPELTFTFRRGDPGSDWYPADGLQ